MTTTWVRFLLVRARRRAWVKELRNHTMPVQSRRKKSGRSIAQTGHLAGAYVKSPTFAVGL